MPASSPAQPRVSVVMPTYNVAAYVEAATESILQQTFTDFELIIIDDGSTDDTWAVLERLAAQDPRIRLERNSANRGISYSRNRGTELAYGEYIAVMDHDDISMPDRLEKQVAYLDAHPEVGVVGGALRFLYGETLGPVRTFPVTPGLIAWTMCFDIPAWHPTCMLRRCTLVAVGGYSLEYVVSNDHDLWFRISRQTRLANLPDIMLHYRRHNGNFSGRANPQLKHETLNIAQRAIEAEIGAQLTLSEVRRLLYGVRSPSVHTANMANILRRLAYHMRAKYQLTSEEWTTVLQGAASSMLTILRHRPDNLDTVASVAYAVRFAPVHTLYRLVSYLWKFGRSRLARWVARCQAGAA